MLQIFQKMVSCDMALPQRTHNLYLRRAITGAQRSQRWHGEKREKYPEGYSGHCDLQTASACPESALSLIPGLAFHRALWGELCQEWVVGWFLTICMVLRGFGLSPCQELTAAGLQDGECPYRSIWTLVGRLS